MQSRRISAGPPCIMAILLRVGARIVFFTRTSETRCRVFSVV